MIDAYLGAHHDVDLGAMAEEEAVEELGLAPDALDLAHLHEPAPEPDADVTDASVQNVNDDPASSDGEASE